MARRPTPLQLSCQPIPSAKGEQVPILWPLIFETGMRDSFRAHVFQVGKPRQQQRGRHSCDCWHFESCRQDAHDCYSMTTTAAISRSESTTSTPILSPDPNVIVEHSAIAISRRANDDDSATSRATAGIYLLTEDAGTAARARSSSATSSFDAFCRLAGVHSTARSRYCLWIEDDERRERASNSSSCRSD